MQKSEKLTALFLSLAVVCSMLWEVPLQGAAANTESRQVFYQQDFEAYEPREGYLTASNGIFALTGDAEAAGRSVDIKQNADGNTTKYARLNNPNSDKSIRVTPDVDQNRLVSGDFIISFRMRNDLGGGATTVDMRTKNNINTRLLILWGDGRVQTTSGDVQQGGQNLLCDPEVWYDFEIRVKITGKDAMVYDVYRKTIEETDYTLIVQNAPGAAGGDYNNGMQTFQFDMSGADDSSWFGLDDIMVSRPIETTVMTETLRNFQNDTVKTYTGSEAEALGAYSYSMSTVSIEEEDGVKFLKIAPLESVSNDPGIYLLKGNTIPGRVSVEARVRLSNMVSITDSWHGHIRALASFDNGTAAQMIWVKETKFATGSGNQEGSNLFLGDGRFSTATNGADIFDHTADSWYRMKFTVDPATRHMAVEVRDDNGTLLFVNDWIAWNTEFSGAVLTDLYLQQPYTNAGGGIKRRTDISVSEIKTGFEGTGVTVNVGANGKLLDNGTEVRGMVVVPQNSSKGLQIVPDTGYAVDTVTVQGVEYSFNGETGLVLSHASEPASLSVSFKKQEKTNTKVEIERLKLDFEEFEVQDDVGEQLGDIYQNNGPSPKTVDIKQDDPTRSKYVRLNNTYTGESMRIFPDPKDEHIITGDYSVEFSMKNAAAEGDSIGTPFFNMRTPTNKASEMLTLWNNGKFAIGKADGTRRTISKPLYERDTWYDFRLDVAFDEDNLGGTYQIYWRPSGQGEYELLTSTKAYMQNTDYGAGIFIPLFDYTGGSKSSWLGLDNFRIYQMQDFAVISAEPANHAQSISLDPIIKIELNSQVKADSVTADTVKLTQNGQAVALSYMVNDTMITAVPQTSLFSAAEYTLTIDGVKADNGAVLAESYSSVFTTVDNAPIATDVSIQAPAMATGETIKGVYRYNCVNPQGGSTFRWLRGDSADGKFDPIDGAVQQTYVLTEEDEGKYLKFEVTPKSSVAPTDGAPVESQAVLGAVEPTASNVRLNAGAVVSRTVEALFDYDDQNGGEEGVHQYQWYVADSETAEPVAITGETAADFLIGNSYNNKYLIVGVTPVSTQRPDQGIEVRSQPVLVTSSNSAPQIKDLSIAGTSSVGMLVQADYHFIDPDGDTEGSSAYAWFISDSEEGDYTPIQGQKAKQLLLTEEYEGKYLKVSVTPVDSFGMTGQETVSSAILVEGKIPNTFYVSNIQGDDHNDGSFEHPFATLEGARNAIRDQKQQGMVPESGFTVYVRGGTYQLSESFQLNEQDSGEEGAPIVYRPYQDEKVILSGGVNIDYDAFCPVEGDMRELLRVPEARDHVVVADLDEIGLSGYTGIPIINDAAAAPLVMFDGQQMTLSRYPNSLLSDDWPLEYVGNGYPGTNPGTAERFDPDADPVPFTVAYSDDVISTWTYNIDKMITFGYWYASWYGEARYLASINPENKTFTSQHPAFYGVSNGRPFCMMNVYEELDMPGEWYIDETARKMYLYPFDVEAGDKPEIHMTKQQFDLVTIDGAENVTLQGFVITMGRENGVTINDSKNVLIRDCEISVFEKFGGVINGGKNCGFDNCEVTETGTGGIDLTGGDETNLEKGEHFVKNCKIHNFTLIKKSYAPGIYMKGAGNTASHNELYNCDHAAIIFEGPDMVIEFNHFYDIGHNSTDMGAIYAGRSLTRMGTEIRYNYFEHLGSTFQGTHGMQSIFLDDGLSGTFVHHNVFGPGSGPNYATKIYGGQENYFTSNLYLDTPFVNFNQSFGNNTWSAIMNGDQDQVGNLETLDGPYGALYGSLLTARENPLYIARWPWLAETGTKAGNQYKSNVFENNVMAFISVEKDDNYQAYRFEPARNVENNTIIEGSNKENKALFVDYDGGDYTLKPGTDLALERPEVASIPFREIGRKAVVNQAPEAVNVVITGEVGIGNTLIGNYLFADPERDQEGKSQLLWMVSSTEQGEYTPIEGGNGAALVFTQELSGKFIKFRVIPADDLGNIGQAYDSAVLRAIADKESLLTLIEQIEQDTKEIENQQGSGLGQYPQDAIDNINQVIQQARDIYHSQTAEVADLVAAADLLSNTFALLQQSRITSMTVNEGEGTITIPGGLPKLSLEIPNLTGKITLMVPEGELPETIVTATVNGKQLTVQAPAGTKTEQITLIESLDENSVKIYGDLYSAFRIGNQGETYLDPLRIHIAGGAGQEMIYIHDGAQTTITGHLTEDSSVGLGSLPYGTINSGNDLILWTRYGGEYAVASLYEPSSDAALSSITVDGMSVALKENQFSYVISSSKASVVVKAIANHGQAMVQPDEQIISVPGTVEFVVTAEDGETINVYKVRINSAETKETDASQTVFPAASPSGFGTWTPIVNTNPNSQNQDNQIIQFTDIVGHWAEDDINEMVARGIVSGVTSTTFEPDREITRAEFAALVVRALNLTTGSGTGRFYDVDAEHWYAPEVSAAVSAGLISGYNGYFRPEDYITREEMAVVIMQAYQFLGKQISRGTIDKFVDQDKISGWAFTYVDQAASVGLISGLAIDIFGPLENATRAQAASLIKRLLDQ